MIAEDEHRCHRCGRRLQDSPAAYPVGNSATAPVLEPAPETATLEVPRLSPGAPARQVPLFDDRPKIIPFESIAGRKANPRGERLVRQSSPARQSGARQSAVRSESQTGTQSVAVSHAGQQPLDLRAPAPRQKTAVSDEIPVAMPSARLHAAALDAGFLAMGIAGAAATFCLMGGRFVLSAGACVPYAVTIAALALFYHLFWCVLGRESAGMRALGLCILTFDGHPPVWQQRVARFLLAVFGVGALGVGVLWSLIDDEGLAMHDHISKTFPTEYDPHPSTMRRR